MSAVEITVKVPKKATNKMKSCDDEMIENAQVVLEFKIDL